MNKILLSMFMLLSMTAFTQETQNLGKVQAGFNGIGLSYEHAFSPKITWENTIGIGGGNAVNDFPSGKQVSYRYDLGQPSVFARTELKYFYNLTKRSEKGKQTAFNSGNYIAYQGKYMGENEYTAYHNQSLVNEIHWGLQRQLGQGNFLMDLQLGAGYIYDYNTKASSVLPTLGFEFGYVIFK